MISAMLHMAWEKWLYGLFAALIGGGASAVTSAVTASMIAPDTFNLAGGMSKTLSLIGVTFALNGVLNMFFYLKQQPLPPILEGQLQIDEITGEAKAVNVKVLTVATPNTHCNVDHNHITNKE